MNDDISLINIPPNSSGPVPPCRWCLTEKTHTLQTAQLPFLTLCSHPSRRKCPLLRLLQLGSKPRLLMSSCQGMLPKPPPAGGGVGKLSNLPTDCSTLNMAIRPHCIAPEGVPALRRELVPSAMPTSFLNRCATRRHREKERGGEVIPYPNTCTKVLSRPLGCRLLNAHSIYPSHCQPLQARLVKIRQDSVLCMRDL